MSKLNQEERRYVLKRVDDIKKDRINQLTSLCMRPVAKSKSRTNKQREIVRGMADLLPQSQWNLKTAIEDCYDWQQDEEELDKEAYNKAMIELRKEVACITDEAVLGDAAKAKELLAKFEATVKV